MVLMCVGSIELVWDGKVWKNGRKTHILGIFGGHVPVHPSRTEHVPVHVRNMYRYTLLCFDQFSYFSHNLLISYPI